MNDIGYDAGKYSLLSYYQAWQLRGDHPRIYQTCVRCPRLMQCPDRTGCDTCSDRISSQDDHPFWHVPKGSYESFYQQKAPALAPYRGNEAVRALCWLYHYDYEIKCKGKKIAPYRIDPQIIPVIETLQNRIQHHLMESGISIECNPSSNVLIGSFCQYCEHPMFRFNRHGIRVPEWEHETPANLCISINTDDQGVFDTSLESEYAYVARSMERERDDNGERINSNDAIYAYLDHIRVLGNSQTFHHKASRIFTSSAGDYQVFRAHLLSLGSRDVSV